MALGLATNLNGMVGIRSGPTGLDFHLPPELEASMPPESRGLARDQVRLMVSHYSDDRVEHITFRRLPEFLRPGDLLVINTSGTLNAALPAHREDGSPMLLHLSTRLPRGEWVVEVRQPEGGVNKQFLFAASCETLALPGGALAKLERPHPGSFGAVMPGRTRLWIATLTLPCPWSEYLARFGALEIPREDYRKRLNDALARRAEFYSDVPEGALEELLGAG